MTASHASEQPSEAARVWTSTQDDDVTASSINDVLSSVRDDLWVTAACVERILDDLTLERELITLGLRSSLRLVAQAQEGVATVSASVEDDSEDEPATNAPGSTVAATFFATHGPERQACSLRIQLLERQDRLDTYQQLVDAHALVASASDVEANVDADDDDPWADDDDDEPTTDGEQPRLTLRQFLQDDILDTALELAATSTFKALPILLRRHAELLLPHRLRLLESIPEHNHPSRYLTLLPRLDPAQNCEVLPVDPSSQRTAEWCESPEVVQAVEGAPRLQPEPVTALSGPDLSAWYKTRTVTIERRSGMVDVALAFVQYGASQGISGLEELGEELSLLERLVYDAPQAQDSARGEDWTLDRWRSLQPRQVVDAYLLHATVDNIADTIRSLVLPYLYVIEARLERSGAPDPGLPQRLLTDYLLETPLSLLAAVFSASKPTLPKAQRVITDNLLMARLALACLYGSDSRNEWGTMSSIFECLPAWAGAQGAEEQDEADTTLASLGAFVTPSATKPRCTPADLLVFFTPLPAFALSRALDVLDVHLDSGEILSRWNVPAPMRWFLLSSDNVAEQRAFATRMAHRAGGGHSDEMENEDDWETLKEDMLKLATSGNGPLAGPFGRLDKSEVLRIFFHGLLSSTRFDIAHSLLNPTEEARPLEPQVIEDLVLEVSQEFYDNATSGNLHTGDMRLAYECLNVAPPTSNIRKQREFIEATSRICSYNVRSRSGHPISPIEIRLEKDRLSLIARVLASTDDAYKHSQVMLELANKLGVPGDARVYGMLADAALAAEDFTAAEVNSGKMIAAVGGPEDAEVAWRTAFQLGRQAEWTDLQARLRLLAHAAKMCPAEHTLDILTTWRKVEGEHLAARKDSPGTTKREPKRERKRDRVGTAITSLASRLQAVQMPNSPASSDTAARVLVAGGQRAAATLSRVAGAFPFGGGHHRSNSDESRSRTPDVSGAARHALSRGVGWLIGDD